MDSHWCRALYGEYLAGTAETALATLRGRGWRTRVVAARIVAVTRSRGLRLALYTEDGHEHMADQVVLCVGGGTPQDHYGLGGAHGFVGDPYPLASTLDQIQTGADVAVIGSGLTAVDVAVSLAARGHAGRIALVSRTGMLPHVYQRPLDYRPRHVTVERVEALGREHGGVTLDDLARLLRAELAEKGEDFARFTTELLMARSEEPVRWLRAQLAAIDDPRIGRRVLQQSAYTVAPYAWRLLPESDRERLRRYRRLATSVAAPMVPVNAAALLGLFDPGQLTTAPGVRKIETVGRGFRVRGDGGDLNADVVVNALNPPPQTVPRAAEQLVTSLLTDGLAALYPSGGLAPADPRLHVVGDFAAGSTFITSGILGCSRRGPPASTARSPTSSPASTRSPSPPPPSTRCPRQASSTARHQSRSPSTPAPSTAPTCSTCPCSPAGPQIWTTLPSSWTRPWAATSATRCACCWPTAVP